MPDPNSNRSEQFKKLEVEIADRAAGRSLDWYSETHGLRSRIEIDTILKHLHLKSSATVLDAGAGVGRIALEVARKAHHVTAIDISPRSIEYLRRHAKKLGLTNVEATAMDLNELSLRERTFDRVTAIEVIQHIPAHELRMDALRRIYKVMRSDGLFVTVNYKWKGAISDKKEDVHEDGRYRIAFTPNEMKTMLIEAGFKDVKVRGCVNLPYRLQNFSSLPPSFLVHLDVWISTLPLSCSTGQFLLASCRT